MKRTNESTRIHTVNNIFLIILVVLIIATVASLVTYVQSGVEGVFFIGPFYGDVLVFELLLLLEGFLQLRF